MVHWGWCGYVADGEIASHLAADRGEEDGEDWSHPKDMVKAINSGNHGSDPTKYPNGQSILLKWG